MYREKAYSHTFLRIIPTENLVIHCQENLLDYWWFRYDGGKASPSTQPSSWKKTRLHAFGGKRVGVLLNLPYSVATFLHYHE
jgi:hypothetical protein